MAELLTSVDAAWGYIMFPSHTHTRIFYLHALVSQTCVQSSRLSVVYLCSLSSLLFSMTVWWFWWCSNCKFRNCCYL